MQITWHGLNCLRLESKDVSVLIDPFNDDSGYKLPRAKVDIVVAHMQDSVPPEVGGEPFVIDVPGEYEKQGVFVYGAPTKLEKTKDRATMFRINIEDLSIGHIGAADKPLTPEALEILEGVDILCIPVGNDALSAKDAVEIISQVEPRIVIPMDYHTKGLNEKRQGPETFLKELGSKSETVDKLKITKKDLPTDDRRVYLIERS